MKVQFSIDLHDHDGDKFENGIYLHVSDSTILRFANLREICDFQIDLTAAMKDIKTAYVDADDSDCKTCDDTGLVDSGGQNPDGTWINRECPDCTERDPDIEMEEREERKRIAMEMDGPHEESP